MQGSERHHYRQRMLYANVHSFASRTSAHGLGRFFAQQIPWLRLVWTAVVIGALTGLTMHTYKQISLFRDYPVSSTTRLLTNQFTFPDVTFCDPLMKKFLTKQSEELRGPDASLNNFFVLSYGLAHRFSNPADDSEVSSAQAIKIAYASFEHAVHTWPKFNMTDVSARILDLLVHCQYNQEPCSEKNFSVFYHRDYGNCFSFKASNRLMKSSGVEKGLVLVLYSPSVDIIQNNDIYSTIVTTGLETGGLRVVVHQKDTIPYPSEYGINSPSGMQTVLALNQVQTSLANTPTKRCEPTGKFETYDHLLDKPQWYEKQLADCTTFEHLRSVQKECNCTLEGLVETRTHGAGDQAISFCHDIMGAHEPDKLRQMLAKMEALLVSNPVVKKYHLFDKDKLHMGKYLKMPVENRIQLSQELERAFPSVKHRLDRLQCAMPKSKSGQSLSRCLNMCKYTTYDFSVFQSRWPDLSLNIRGARIRLARIARMLQQRVDLVNKLLDTNHALNHSIVSHEVNLRLCMDKELDKRENLFGNDSHCSKVHNIIRQSFLQLRVYPKTLTVRQLYEERSYELVNLFSDLGGIMGLWIGVSMVTLCEFAEIILILASYYARSAVRRLQNFVGPLDQGTESAGSDHPEAPRSRRPHRSFDHTSNPLTYRQPRLASDGTRDTAATLASNGSRRLPQLSGRETPL